MPIQVLPAIPASNTVNVIPSVLSAGGNALDLIGLILTRSTRPPLGQVLQFVDQTDVANYFGPTSQEAGLATIYFTGPNNATAQPGAMIMAQYPLTATVGYLRSGTLSGVSLAALQGVDANLTVTIDGGSPTSQTVNLSAATSFSNAAYLMGNQLGIVGPQVAAFTASLSGSTMTVTVLGTGPVVANVTASLSTTTMTVTAISNGILSVGDVVAGTGITTGTTIASFGSGTGGIGTYNLSASATTETAEAIIAYAPCVVAVGQVISGTGITVGTYIAALGTGTGGLGTYTTSAAMTTESAEAIVAYAPAVTYDPVLNAFVISSGTTGAASSVGFGTGPAATSLLFTQQLGAVLSPGAAATSPGAFMPGITAITQNWLSFMTTWEPTDADKEGFATWTNGGGTRYRYCMWDTNVTNTESGGPSAPVAFINAGDLTGTVMIHENPAVDATGETAAFAMSFAASLDFTRTNGRMTAKFKSQSGLAGQIFNGSIAGYLTGYGMNFYGVNTTANEAFTYFANGNISGPFIWDDSYCDSVWLENELQLAIMVLLTSVGSIPYNTAGYTLLEAAMMDPINAAVNFGAIVAGVPLSAEQAAAVNNSAGLVISGILSTRGWYLQVLAASAQVRAARTSPPCTLWYTDGGSIQQVTLASQEIQ